MEPKSIVGIILVVAGIAGLIIGVSGIFSENLTKQNPWIFGILGFIFFSSGIGLLKSTGKQNIGS
jgi:uncharacterized membrane protein